MTAMAVAFEMMRERKRGWVHTRLTEGGLHVFLADGLGPCEPSDRLWVQMVAAGTRRAVRVLGGGG